MSVENAIIGRINSLIEQGTPISPVGKLGHALTYDEVQATSGWLTSAYHAVELVCGTGRNAYRMRCGEISAKYAASDIDVMRANDTKSECVGEMVSVLQNLLIDVEAGLISSLEDRIRAETFDDFLDHAEKYHKEDWKESGVIAGVVFEDTIRRIAKNNEIDGGPLEDIINALAKKEVISQTKAKRAKVAAHVRTKATHALWAEFELDDVKVTIDFTRELIAAHLDG